MSRKPKVGDRFVVSRKPDETSLTFGDYENGDTGKIVGVGDDGVRVGWETNLLGAPEGGRCDFLFEREITILETEEEDHE